MAMEQAINLQSEGVSDSTDTSLMYEKVERVNAILRSQEPGNISEDEYSHYTGYKPQSIKNAMNKVFGLGMWGYQEIASEVVKDDSGKPLIVGKVQVWIVGVDWKPEAWGQSRIMRGDIGDAHKSMVTDGMKKGLSDFSIGDRAYLGLLPGKKEQGEQARAENANASKPTQTTNAAPRPQQARTQAPAKPAPQALPANTVPTALQPNAERPYLPFFSSGREKGLWSDFTGFCQFATAELGVEVNRDNVRSLTSEQLAILDIAIKEEAPVKKTA